jgi:hypothetical protein
MAQEQGPISTNSTSSKAGRNRDKYIHKRYNQIILDIQIANIELGTSSNR